jgi:hypothetical protein
VWREVTEFVVDAVDRQRLSVRDVLGVEEESNTLLGGYRAKIIHGRDVCRSKLERLVLADPVNPDGEALPAEIARPGRPRRRWIRRIVGLVIFVVSVVAFGLLFPAITLLVALAIAGLAAVSTTLLTTLLASFVEVIADFRQQFLPDDPERDLVIAMEHWMTGLVRLSTRASQLSEWSVVLGRLFTDAGAGPAIDVREQHEFLPALGPRALQVATGIVSDTTIADEAKAIRSSEADEPYFRAVWEGVITNHADAFAEASRRSGALASLVVSARAGFSAAVNEIARDIVRRRTTHGDPSRLLAGVVPWMHELDARGLEMIRPDPANGSLGPVHRQATTSPTDRERVIGEYSRRRLDVTNGAGQQVGEATWIGGFAFVPSGMCDGPTLHVAGIDRTPAATGELSFIRWEPGDDPPQIGGIGTISSGSVVLVVSRVDNTVVTATVETIALDGSMQLDHSGLPGSAVADLTTGRVVGMVGLSGTVFGVSALRRALLEASAAQRHADDLDPGFALPLDVLLGSGRAVDTSSAPNGETAPLPTSAWFKLLNGRPGYFRALPLNDHPGFLAVDAAETIEFAVQLLVLPDDRFVFVHRLLQTSALFLVGQLPWVAAGVGDEPVVDDSGSEKED